MLKVHLSNALFSLLLIVFILGTQQTFAEESKCLVCHGGKHIELKKGFPSYPDILSMKWKMFEFKSKGRPPFVEIPSDAKFILGETYYDVKKKMMTEIYHNKCIDIFPEGRNFSCQFLSVDSKTYFIRFLKDNTIKDCRLWSKNAFYAPSQHVAHLMKKETKKLSGHKSWYVLDIPRPGPFGLGFDQSLKKPMTFWFPVIQGWVQQEFFGHKFSVDRKDVFKIPKKCVGL